MRHRSRSPQVHCRHQAVDLLEPLECSRAWSHSLARTPRFRDPLPRYDDRWERRCFKSPEHRRSPPLPMVELDLRTHPEISSIGRLLR